MIAREIVYSQGPSRIYKFEQTEERITSRNLGALLEFNDE